MKSKSWGDCTGKCRLGLQFALWGQTDVLYLLNVYFTCHDIHVAMQ